MRTVTPESANAPHHPRYLLDSNIADALAADGKLPALAAAARSMEILITQLQGDELAATPPAKGRREKMEALRAMVSRVVETSGAAAGPSHTAGAAETSSGGGHGDSERGSDNSANPALHQALLARRTRPEKHRRDALLATTAAAENATLVTEDASLRAICSEHAISAIPYAQFRDHLLGRSTG